MALDDTPPPVVNASAESAVVAPQASTDRSQELAVSLWQDMGSLSDLSGVLQNTDAHRMLNSFGIDLGPRVSLAAATGEPQPPAPPADRPPPPAQPALRVADGTDNAPARPEQPPAADPRMERVRAAANWLVENFRALDPQNTGVLTRELLERAIQNPSIANGEGAVHLATIYRHFERLNDVFDREGAGGIGLQSMARFVTQANLPNFLRDNDRALAQADLRENFAILCPGTVADRRMTIEQVDTALRRTDLSTRQRQALTDLRGYMDDLRAGRVERPLVPAGDALIGGPVPETGALMLVEIQNRASSETRLIGSIANDSQLIRERLAAINRPNAPRTISQGQDGTCSFIAPLIALEQLDRQAVTNMIARNKNGTYTVTFPGDRDRPITVNAPTDAYMGIWGRGREAAILESAFAQRWMREHPDRPRPSTIATGNVDSGLSDHSLALLTGRQADALNLRQSTVAQLRERLVASTNARTPLVGDTNNRTPDNIGLVPMHGYAITYDAARDEVILQNPARPTQANGNVSSYPHEPHRLDGRPLDGTDDGRFRMSLADFHRHFNRMTFVR